MRGKMPGQHNKIINAAAKKILAPEGLFRVGASRRWIDDNGYFVIQVEFQPSAYDRGSYLNVGISFLWEASKGLNDTLAFNIGYRVDKAGYASYRGNDAAYEEKMEHFAEAALEKVREYRLFRDMGYAKEQMESQLNDMPGHRVFWEVYELAMLCFLKRDFEEGKEYFGRFLQILKDSFYVGKLYIEWHEELYDHCIKHLCPELKSEETAYKMVCEMIARRRDFFASKPSYKKLKKEFTL
ncbi:hypothetical protein [Lachnoclostridium sp. An118]|uniref:hypothetical protein n=1 Tax=Lachnoclostridium sp. An118 TaxID=1965547 RepID=UPI00117B2A5F|nr:hypothetical protein [Lachnoclostridium sp. An118]